MIDFSLSPLGLFKTASLYVLMYVSLIQNMPPRMADKSVDKPILLISMVENVKGIGGSGYVVKKDATVLDEYFEE